MRIMKCQMKILPICIYGKQMQIGRQTNRISVKNDPLPRQRVA